MSADAAEGKPLTTEIGRKVVNLLSRFGDLPGFKTQNPPVIWTYLNIFEPCSPAGGELPKSASHVLGEAGHQQGAIHGIRRVGTPYLPLGAPRARCRWHRARLQRPAQGADWRHQDPVAVISAVQPQVLPLEGHVLHVRRRRNRGRPLPHAVHRGFAVSIDVEGVQGGSEGSEGGLVTSQWHRGRSKVGSVPSVFKLNS